MAALRQLRDPARYRPCDWDLKADGRGRRYWVRHFCRHLAILTAGIVENHPQAPARLLEQFRREYLAALEEVEHRPQRYERIDILLLDQLRHELLRRYGFEDPFGALKRRQNGAALRLLPRVLSELDACGEEALPQRLAVGLLAGNVYDLGASAAVQRRVGTGTELPVVSQAPRPRPWLVDDLAAWQRYCRQSPPHRHVAFFVDNSGADICLGCLPLARWLLMRGTRVTLAANSAPALNDVTAGELESLLRQTAGLDGELATALDCGRLSVVATGGTAPLLDLTALTAECAEALADADLIILQGMGRAVESNWQAEFSCDNLRVAVLKDRAVARRLGGRLFDCVFRFENVPAR